MDQTKLHPIFDEDPETFGDMIPVQLFKKSL
jgi:hypothetical protein